MKLTIIVSILILSVATSSLAAEEEERWTRHNLFQGAIVVNAPSTWVTNHFDIEGAISDQFSDPHGKAAIAVALEHKPEMSFSSYVKYRRRAADEHLWKIKKDNPFKLTRKNHVMHYISRSGKTHKYLVMFKGKDSYTTVTIMIKTSDMKSKLAIAKRFLASMQYE